MAKRLLTSVIGLVVVVTTVAAPVSAFAAEDESPVDSIVDIVPDVLANVANVPTESDGSSAVIDENVAGTQVEVPASPGDGVYLASATTGATLSIGLPFSQVASPAEVVSPGVVSYDNRNGTATVPVVNADGSMTVTSVIEGPEAPTAFPYALTADAGVQLTPLPDGGVQIADDHGTVTAVIAPPWAKDAAGADLPTHYEIVSDTVVQHVDVTGPGVLFPVVADPTTSWLWWGQAVKLTRSETKLVASKTGGYYAFISGFCAFIPNAPARYTCTTAAGWRVVSWIDPIKQAAAQGRCAQINLPYVPGPVWANVTVERC